MRTAAWHQNDQLLLTAYIDQPGVRRAAAVLCRQAPVVTSERMCVAQTGLLAVRSVWGGLLRARAEA